MINDWFKSFFTFFLIFIIFKKKKCCAVSNRIELSYDLTENRKYIFYFADLSRNAKSLQIVKIKKRVVQGETLHELELNEKNLRKIMLHPDVKDNKVMVVSIAGALRKGKSFLLGFFLKYLEARVTTF